MVRMPSGRPSQTSVTIADRENETLRRREASRRRARVAEGSATRSRVARTPTCPQTIRGKSAGKRVVGPSLHAHVRAPYQTLNLHCKLERNTCSGLLEERRASADAWVRVTETRKIRTRSPGGPRTIRTYRHAPPRSRQGDRHVAARCPNRGASGREERLSVSTGSRRGRRARG